MDQDHLEQQDSNPIQDTKSTNHRQDKKRSAKSSNPLLSGIEEFVTGHLSPSILSEHGLSPETLESALPKRYTIYEPLLLLPVNALSSPPAWNALYTSLDIQQREALYASIVKAFSRLGVTHVAINAPIAATDNQGQENKMRSPVGLVPLYGDFGPLPSGDGENAQPTETDFQNAFWVHTVQNHGIAQIWSPLYTMFSRGNITEKARILGHGSTFEGLDEHTLTDEKIQDVSVVDMYAGIGYFVFSYLKRGVRRVWGFEINGWSVEGLRRGCTENGWGCKVVRIQSDGSLSEPIPQLVGNLQDSDRVVIFHGDNRFAADIMSEIKDIMENQKCWSSIRHVNLGLLPSSSAAWDNACKMIDLHRGGWIHVHENVDMLQVDQKKGEIVGEIKNLRTQVLHGTVEPVVECRHVEHVKTYAPGIMHCVFDIKLSSVDKA